MIQDSDIKRLTELFVEIGNRDGGLNRIFEQYRDSRSLAIRITDSKYQTGFIFRDGRIHLLTVLDKPTVTISMDKLTYWNIATASTVQEARARIFAGVFTNETIRIDPPPGIGGGVLHVQNLVRIFTQIAKVVME